MIEDKSEVETGFEIGECGGVARRGGRGGRVGGRVALVCRRVVVHVVLEGLGSCLVVRSVCRGRKVGVERDILGFSMVAIV